MRTNTATSATVTTTVVKRNGSLESLVPYLCKRFPTLFSAQPSGIGEDSGQVLTMRKDPNIAELILGLRVDGVLQAEDWSAFTPPVVRLVETDPL